MFEIDFLVLIWIILVFEFGDCGIWCFVRFGFCIYYFFFIVGIVEIVWNVIWWLFIWVYEYSIVDLVGVCINWINNVFVDRVYFRRFEMEVDVVGL